jgi:hypothetical protein
MMSELARVKYRLSIEVDEILRDSHRPSLMSLNRHLKTLSRRIEGQLFWKDATAKFDCDKVKELPSDIIALIKEFMEDDIEQVRKAWCIVSFFPSTIFEFDRSCISLYFTSRIDKINCENFVEQYCKKIKKDKLYKIWDDDDLPKKITKKQIMGLITHLLTDTIVQYKTNKLNEHLTLNTYKILRLLQIN